MTELYSLVNHKLPQVIIKDRSKWQAEVCRHALGLPFKFRFCFYIYYCCLHDLSIYPVYIVSRVFIMYIQVDKCKYNVLNRTRALKILIF